jgi:IS1 family transposase
VWPGIERNTQKILGVYVGDRTQVSFDKFTDKIAHLNVKKYASDWWKAYNIISEALHLWGKAHTYTVERTNKRLRYYLARLARRTYCTSKSTEMLYLSIVLFMLKDYFGEAFFYLCICF